MSCHNVKLITSIARVRIFSDFTTKIRACSILSVTMILVFFMLEIDVDVGTFGTFRCADVIAWSFRVVHLNGVGMTYHLPTL